MTKVLKLVKIIGIALASLALIIIIVGFLISEKLPDGQQSEEADLLAKAILKELNYDAFKKTNRIIWTFAGIHDYDWHKNENYVIVSTKDYKLKLDLQNYQNSQVISPKDANKEDLIASSIKKFNNDSFWLVAPYKLMEEQVERKIVNVDNEKHLLVTYTSGGSTPGDSYLWKIDSNNRPTAFKMWVSIIPIGGIEAKWMNWKTTSTGAILSTQKKVFGIPVNISNLKTEF